MNIKTRNGLVQFIKYRQTLDVFWCGIVVLGIILRLRQYLTNRSLWVDEASLALNILERSFSSLSLPLDYDQGAPIGFLFIQKFLVLIFGNSEYTLRLFPLISGGGALYLIYRVAKTYFSDFVFPSVLLFAISIPMIYYSSELKQYSTDVMVSLLLIYLALLCLNKSAAIQTFVVLGLAGVFSILLSHPSVFTLSVIGVSLFVDEYLNKDYMRLRRLVGVGILWGATFLGTYLISLQYLIGNENLQDYWKNSYAPFPPWEHIGWYKNVFVVLLPHINPSFLRDIFPGFSEEYLILGALLLVFVGMLSLLFRNFKMAVIFITPFVVAFIASGLNRYPMSDRFLYFWLPSLFLLMGEGLWRLYAVLSKYNNAVAWAVYGMTGFILLWSPIQYASTNFFKPQMGEDIKPVLAYVRDHLQEGDKVYVHNGSVTPFLYYETSYSLNTADTFVALKSWNVKRFIVDVKDFHGEERVWFIFSHVVSCDCDGNTREDRIQAHVNVLDQYGSQLDYFAAANANTYLYDLNP